MFEALVQRQNDTDKQYVQEIMVDRIRPNPYQPRRNFDHSSLEELAASIKEHGVMQPITVRKLHNGYYELVAGERRLRASKMAGLKQIPTLIVHITDNQSAVLALLENLQRQDLTYMEEAVSYYHLIHEHGLTQDELAQKMGKNQSTVANKLRLLKLPPLVRKILNDQQLTERHARALLKLPDEQMQLKVLRTVCAKNMNVAQTEELIFKQLNPKQAQEKNDDKVKSFSLKDMRVVYNTLEQALTYIVKAGVSAKMEQIERKDCIEVVFSIPKEI